MPDQKRFMYHNFPRRRTTDDPVAKGLAILKLIVSNGLLLTPEVEHWRDSKTAPSPAEDYVAVARRCCFTELAEKEVLRHAEYFGSFALEFESRVLVDLGAMPVFYVPRTTGTDGYGPGPALVTQLAHVQELVSRINEFRRFAAIAADVQPAAPVLGVSDTRGGLVLSVPGLDITVIVPREIIDRARQVNPRFNFVPPATPQTFGLTAAALNSLLNLLHWGIHDPDVLTGTIKALGSLFYSTERADDPFLSHYRQREWRIIGGVRKNGREVSAPISEELRRALLELDAGFFGRTIYLPIGAKTLVDECEAFGGPSSVSPLVHAIRRVLAPASVLAGAAAIFAPHPGVDVVAIESLA